MIVLALFTAIQTKQFLDGRSRQDQAHKAGGLVERRRRLADCIGYHHRPVMMRTRRFDFQVRRLAAAQYGMMQPRSDYFVGWIASQRERTVLRTGGRSRGL